jgi:hypothetical protein
VTDIRTGRDVITDLIADASTWKLTPLQEIAYLKRVQAYQHDLLERAERAERTPADREKSADHFGRWFAVSSYLIALLDTAFGAYVIEAYGIEHTSIHSEEQA